LALLEITRPCSGGNVFLLRDEDYTMRVKSKPYGPVGILSTPITRGYIPRHLFVQEGGESGFLPDKFHIAWQVSG